MEKTKPSRLFEKSNIHQPEDQLTLESLREIRKLFEKRMKRDNEIRKAHIKAFNEFMRASLLKDQQRSKYGKD